MSSAFWGEQRRGQTLEICHPVLRDKRTYKTNYKAGELGHLEQRLLVLVTSVRGGGSGRVEAADDARGYVLHPLQVVVHQVRL